MIEDGFDEDDWHGWTTSQKTDGHRVQIVGDDLFVTQQERLARGIEIGAKCDAGESKPCRNHRNP